MASFNNQSKNSDITATNESKNSVAYKEYLKAGSAQQYDSELTYDELVDPISNNPVFYDGVGTTPTWTNQSKS